MQIPKDQILQLLRGRGEDTTAEVATAELPDQVDTDTHADLLSKIGIDPADLLGGGDGDAGGGSAGKLGL